MTSNLSSAQIIKDPIQEGDCGVILRKNGSFSIFSTGKIDPENLSDAQMEQGLLMTAIALCLNTPQLREQLINLASNPAVVGHHPFAATVN